MEKIITKYQEVFTLEDEPLSCTSLTEHVVFEETLEQHNKNVQLVIDRIKKLGLKLESTKCEYLKPELEYLGHL